MNDFLFFFLLNVPASKFSFCSILEGVSSSVRHSIQSFVLISFTFVNKPALFKASIRLFGSFMSTSAFANNKSPLRAHHLTCKS